jgi:pimeloyl-CoA synthetase
MYHMSDMPNGREASTVSAGERLINSEEIRHSFQELMLHRGLAALCHLHGGAL